MANSGGGGEFKSDIRKQEKMKFVSVGRHHAAGLEYAMKGLGTFMESMDLDGEFSWTLFFQNGQILVDIFRG